MKSFTAALLVAGFLTGATAAYGAETPPPTVSVEGVATVPISKTASSAEADSAYRQGLAAAIADGLEKAEFLAVKTGSKVGLVQQITEQGGSVGCESAPAVNSQNEYETKYEQYEGARPDFVSVGGATVPEEVASAKAPLAATPVHAKKKKKKKKKGKPEAKKAAGVRCTLQTQIGLSYLLT